MIEVNIMKLLNYTGCCMLVEKVENELFGIDLDYASHSRLD